MSSIEIYTVPIACFIFLLGAIISLLDELTGGIIILVWHLIVWILAMMFWKEAGMVLILIFPMLIISVFLISNWYVANDESYSEKTKRWKLVLRILLFNYAAIYLIIVISEVISKIFGVAVRGDVTTTNGWNFNFTDTILLLVELILFIVACLATLKSILIAGILLIVWYIILLITYKISFAIPDSGPWIFFSIPILIQGILYLFLYLKEKEDLDLL